jgi:hypothetical protein
VQTPTVGHQAVCVSETQDLYHDRSH